MFRMHNRISQMRDLWNSHNRKNKFGFISWLQKGQEWDPAEFHLTGIRFVDRMCERVHDYGSIESHQASVLEIGCGVGRFLKPLACRFKTVYGVDISEEMLKTAREYCSCLPNITYQLSDGKSLQGLDDNSFDYCVSAGVFQHITDISVIISYIREALRVLKPEGLFLFQFEGNRKRAVGRKDTGARITARDLDEGLRGCLFRIREVSIDPHDAVRNIVVVLQKLHTATEDLGEDAFSFHKHKMIERRWISGVYDDIKTKTDMHERQKKWLRLTFYDE